MLLDTRPSLLQRVRAGEGSPSWPEFSRQYRKLVYALARRSGLRRRDAEDVTQDVFTRVAGKIQEFESDPARGSFRSWLMKMTRWRIADKYTANPKPRRRSARGNARDGATESAPKESPAEPQPAVSEPETEWPGPVFDAACKRLARSAKKRHYQVFNLYIRERCHVLRVAREMGINPTKIYAICHRLTKRLRAEAAKLQRQPV